MGKSRRILFSEVCDSLAWKPDCMEMISEISKHVIWIELGENNSTIFKDMLVGRQCVSVDAFFIPQPFAEHAPF